MASSESFFLDTSREGYKVLLQQWKNTSTSIHEDPSTVANGQRWAEQNKGKSEFFSEMAVITKHLSVLYIR